MYLEEACLFFFFSEGGIFFIFFIIIIIIFSSPLSSFSDGKGLTFISMPLETPLTKKAVRKSSQRYAA